MKNKIPSEGLRLGRDSGSILCDTLKKVAFSDSLGGGANYIGLNVKFVNKGIITLGNSVTIRPSTRVYAGNSRSLISFGTGTEIGEHSTISANNRIVFGTDVLTGPHVFVADHNHAYENPYVSVSKQDRLRLA